MIRDCQRFETFSDFAGGRSVPGRSFALGLAVCFLATLAGLPGKFDGASNVRAEEPGASATQVTFDATQQEEPGGTYVAPPDSLLSMLAAGKVPETLQQLRNLETQQRAVAQRVEACTVNVQIGGGPRDAAYVGSTQGCGAIITADGYVLTAAHVAERPGLQVQLTLYDGRRVSATTLGMNRGVDAALIKIDDGQNGGEPWPHASLGSSEELRPGSWCVATGHPGGFNESRGFVTRVGRILAVRANSLVTDCALIGGDSGGPLFDMWGRLIAIHSRIGNDVAENLHVPVHHYDVDWQQLAAGKAWGYLPGFRPVLGVQGSTDTELARIVGVRQGSPAEDAGIQTGDVIQRFGDVLISDFESLKRAVAETMPGKRIVIRLLRDDESKDLVVEIGRDPHS